MSINDTHLLIEVHGVVGRRRWSRAQGSDWVIAGNRGANSTRQSDISASGVRRINVSGNDLANVDGQGRGDGGDTARDTVQLRSGDYGYIGHNVIHTGSILLARVSGGASRWSVVEENDLYDTWVRIGVGADDTRISHNRIQSGGPNTGFFVDGYDAGQGLGIDNLLIEHNSVLQPAYDPAQPGGRRFLKLYGDINGLSLKDNVYDPNGVPFGGYDSWGMSLAASAINMDIGGNVWGPPGSLYQGAYHNTDDGRITPAGWQSHHPTDTFPTQLDAASIGTAGAGILAPHAPDTMTATATAGAIALAWTAAAEGDAADTWNLYRDSGDGHGYRLYQTGLTTTSYTDTNVTADQRYAYKVAGVNARGEGKLSDEAAGVALQPLNEALTISGDDSVDEGAVYTLSMANSFPPGTFSSKIIDWGDGTTDTVNADAVSATHTFPNGPYVFPIQVSAAIGGVTYESNAVDVMIHMVAPQVVISGNTTVTTGSAYTLNLSAIYPTSDADGDQIRQWTIDWGDSSDWQTVDGTVTSLVHTFAPGVATPVVYATATDDDLTYAANPLAVSVTGVTAPQTPVNVTATAYSPTQMDLSWSDPSDNATAFTIEQSLDGGQTWQIVATVDATQTNYSNINLNEATSYSYRVTGTNDAGASDPSDSVSEPTPDKKPSLSSHQDGTQVTLSWDSLGTGVTGYELEMKNLDPTAHENYHLVSILDGSQTNYSASLPTDQTYSFRLRANYIDGTVSKYSNSISVTTIGNPTNLQADPVSNSEIDLSWDASNTQKADGISVEASTDGINFETLGSVGADDTSYKATELADSTTYIFRVRAYREKAFSAEASIQATTLTGPAPDAPSDFDASTGEGLTNVTLTWQDNSNDENGFYIEYRTKDYPTPPGVEEWMSLGNTSANTTTFTYYDPGTLTPLNLNTSYEFRVCAYNNGGQSKWSGIASATTTDHVGDFTVPTAPSDLKATSVEADHLTLHWKDNSDNETHFTILGYAVGSDDPYHDIWTGPSVILSANTTSYTFNNAYAYKIHSDTQYYFVVYAYREQYNSYETYGYSRYSNVLSVHTPPANMPPPDTAPAAPSHIWTHVKYDPYPSDKPSGNEVILAWSNDPDNEDGYKIERSDDGGVTWQQIANTDADETTYTDKQNLLPNDYLYRITAFNDAGQANAITSVGVWPPGQLVAFDGTYGYRNDPALVSGPGKPFNGTVIAGFESKYQQSTDYQRGVGNVIDNPNGVQHALQGAFATEANSQVYAHAASLIQFYQQEDHRKIPLDMIGYSRGAFEAMKVLGMLGNMGGIPDLDSRFTYVAAQDWFGHQTIGIGYNQWYQLPKIRFLGLVSPVGQMGADPVIHTLSGGVIPPIDIDWPRQAPPNVLHFIQVLDGTPDQYFYPQTTMSHSNGTDYDERTFPLDNHHEIGVDTAVLRRLIDFARSVNVPVAKLT